MKKLIFFLIIFISINSFSNPSDSITITFRTYQPPSPVLFVPGEFNNWGPNTNGVISPGAPSQMTYNSELSAWIKTYTFKIKDPADIRRRMADSVFQYKFNKGGTIDGWYSDPLNPETNPSEYNNSVLRMTRLFWFQFYAFEVLQQINRITISLIHANSDSITAIYLSTAQTESAPRTTLDVTQYFNTQTRILDYTLTSPIPKSNFIRLVGYNDKGDSVVYKRGGYVVYTLPMPSYVKHGVTLPSVASNDSTSFRIRVPGKEYVLLRIAPLGQNPVNASPIVMRRATLNHEWWINVKLPKGTYEYVYEIENGKTIFDPWGRWNGNLGSRFSTDSTGLTADDYVWVNTNFQRPPLNKLVIYELNVNEFAGGKLGLGSGEVNFLHLVETLPYLDSLGINAIELMPVNDYGIIGKSGFSWGYDVNSYLSLEPAYGTPRDFKTFVDSAHGRGIAVIVDVVFNHLNETSSLWQMAPNEDINPYFKRCNQLNYNEDQLCFFKDLDHWAPETQELIYTALKMFIDDYKVDGFRYDLTQGIGWNINEPTKGILGWSNKIHQEYDGKIYQIAEHLPESPALIYYSGLSSGWHDSFRDEIFLEVIYRNRPLLNFENLIIDLGAYPGNDSPSQPSKYSDRIEPVNATVNHDEQSLIYEMITFQGVSLEQAILRDKLYATFIFTSLGIPMIWQGMEFSAPRGWQNDNEKLSYRPVEFYLYPTQRGQEHYNYYKALIFQRLNNPALYRGVLRKLYRYDSQRTIVWGFEDTLTNAKLMCLANLSAVQQTITNVPWLADGKWYDIFNKSVLNLDVVPLPNFTIAGYTAKVYSNIPDSVLLDVSGEKGEIPEKFLLYQNYPNPFNPITTIEFSLPVSGLVTLKIYNVLGQEIAELLNGEMKAGNYSIKFDASKFSSGMYLYKLTAGNFTSVKKLLLLK